MSSEEFKNLLSLVRLIGGKFVIVEDGHPQAVLMSYEEFQALVVPQVEKRLVEAAGRIEEINAQITTAQLLDLREEVIQEPELNESSSLRTVVNPDQAITIEPLDRF